MCKAKKIVITLSVVLLVVLMATTIFAIMKEDNGSPYTAVSLRGEQVQVYGGNGLYAYNTVENALMLRAFDWYILLGGIPVLIIGLLLYLRKSVIGYYILLSSIFFCIYNYIINSIAFAYNAYFLVYMAVYVIGLFAAIYIIKSVSFEHFKLHVLPKLPVKLISVYLFLIASYFTISWLIIDFTSLLSGTIHPDLTIYTTGGINITDLSIFAPISISAGIMLLKRKPLGAILSVGIILMVFQEMIALSIFSFLKVAYLNESMAQIEMPFIILVPVNLAIGILAVKKLKGLKYVLLD